MRAGRGDAATPDDEDGGAWRSLPARTQGLIGPTTSILHRPQPTETQGLSAVRFVTLGRYQLSKKLSGRSRGERVPQRPGGRIPAASGVDGWR